MTGHFNAQLRKSIPSILSEKHNRFTFLNLVIMRSIDRFSEYDQQCSNDSLALVFNSRPIKMSPRFVLGGGGGGTCHASQR